MLRLACLYLLLPATAWAQGYADHPAVQAFRDQPCTEVVEVIYTQEAAGLSLAETIALVSRVNLYLGFLIGFDVAHGGLQGSAQTTVARLRDECEQRPQASALELLEQFAGDETSRTSN